MDFDAVLAWLEANKAWFVPSLLTALGMIGGLIAWILRRGSRQSAVDVKEVIAGLQATYREELQEKEEQIQELTKAVEALAQERGKAGAPPGIDAALKQLAEGKTEAAEAIFEQVLDQKRAEGEAASKEAAAAARHIGALAYLRDTQKALSAYAQAVELDPGNPDGWNRLGHLRDRVGNLDGAIAAYERVLRMGNVAEERGVIAAAYGNLGIVFRRRGDLAQAEEYHLNAMAIDKELGRKEGIANQHSGLGLVYQKRGELDQAEEHHLKSLALNEELGRKWSIASDYGNLGNVYQTRGDLAKACEAWAKSGRLFEELGAAPEVAKVQALMQEAGCD